MASASHAAVARTLYRELLKLGKRLDANPLAKALLIAQPDTLFDRRARSPIELPGLDGAAGIWSSALTEFNGGEFHRPNRSAREFVRDRSRALDGPDDAAIDAGLTAMRTLARAISAGDTLLEHAFDCGRPSAVDQATSLRPGHAVRPGSLLLCHPVSCLAQPTLHHSVVLILSVDEQQVIGVVINKCLDGVPLESAVSQPTLDALGPLGQLAGSPLYHGGDVSAEQLLVLHEAPGLADSAHVADGVYATSNIAQLRDGLDRMTEATILEHPASPPEADAGLGGALGAGLGAGGASGASGAAGAAAIAPSAPPRVKCVAGYAGWARDQLAVELERNVWFLAEADGSIADLAMMRSPPASAGEPHGAAWLRDAMWSGAIRQLGGEMGWLASFPGDHALVWKHMQQMWETQNEELHKRIDLLGTPPGRGE